MRNSPTDPPYNQATGLATGCSETLDFVCLLLVGDQSYDLAKAGTAQRYGKKMTESLTCSVSCAVPTSYSKVLTIAFMAFLQALFASLLIDPGQRRKNQQFYRASYCHVKFMVKLCVHRTQSPFTVSSGNSSATSAL